MCIHSFHQIWKVLHPYFFKIFCLLVSSCSCPTAFSHFVFILFSPGTVDSCFILDSFHYYAFEFTNLFFYKVQSTINPIQCIFHLGDYSFQLCKFDLGLSKVSSMSVVNFLNIWKAVITVLMSLSANSNIYASYSLVSTDLLFLLQVIFSFLCTAGHL